MARRAESEQIHRDEQLGEAIEAYLALAEAGAAPDPEEFAERYPEMRADLLAALEGLALVQGLVGDSGHGPGGRLESGRRIAGYRIVGELGRGGMGVVYEAVHVDLDRPVALKVLGLHASPDSNGRRRFLNEARTAASLHHTHIVPVFDVGQVGGLCYYAMQRIEGSGLDRVVKHLRRGRATAAGSTAGSATPFWSRFGARLSPGAPTSARGVPAPTIHGSQSVTGTWPGAIGDPTTSASGIDLTGLGTPRRAEQERDDPPPPFEPPRGSAYYRWVAQVGREAAEALAHAHQRGIIHRDIKPSNLLVDGRGFVWVADFGLARRMADPDQTHHESLIGTPRYMSPEQARSGPIDARTDLYSLGATLFELLTLHPPFEGRSTAELVEQITQLEPPTPRQIDPRIPRDLETIVLKLLSKRREDRYASAVEVADDLGRFLGFEPVRARRISPVGRLWRFAKRHPSGTLVTSAAALTVLFVSAWAYIRVVHERDETVRHLAEKDAVMATTLRLSNRPGRREEGLGLIREAASLRHDPALLGRLRDEAVEFLILRDVEPRAPFATNRARSLAFSADGSTLTTLCSSEDGDYVSTWNVARRQKLNERPLNAPALGLAPSIAIGNPAAAVNGPASPTKPAPRVGPGPGPGSPLGGRRGSLASLGASVAVLATDASAIRRFDATTGERLDDLPMPLHRQRIQWIVASVDGRRLVTVESERAGGPGANLGEGTPGSRGFGLEPTVVNLWDTAKLDKPIKTLARFEPDGSAFPFRALVAISPDGSTIATARMFKSEVSLWSGETGLALGKPFDAQAELSALALGPERRLATAGSGEVRFWDIDARTSHSLTPNHGMVRFLRFSPRGALLAVVGGRDIELWDTAASNPVAVLPSSSDRLDDVAFAPDGQTLAACGQGENSPTQVWTVTEPEARIRLGGFDAPARSLAFGPKGLLAISTMRGMVRFWNGGHCLSAGPGKDKAAGKASTDDDATETSGETQDRPADRDWPVALTFDNHGRLITVEHDALRVWNDPHQTESDVTIDLPGPRNPFAAARDGRSILLGSGNQLALWHSDAPDKLVPFVLPRSPLPPARNDQDRERNRGGRGPRGPTWWRALALSPSGDRAYVSMGRDGPLAAIELNDGQARWLPWSNPLTGVVSLAVSPDGASLAAWDLAGRVSLLDTGSGKLRSQWMTGTPDGLHAPMAFSPDGGKLATSTQQGQIDIWSVATPSAAALRLPGHRGSITVLSFAPNGRYLATAGIDKNVDVWDLDRLREKLTSLGLAW